MNKLSLLFAVILISLPTFAQHEENNSLDSVKVEVEKESLLKSLSLIDFNVQEKVRYKLFPTENIWTFIKLDTRNGKLWQVHFTLSSDGYEGEIEIDSNSLVWGNEEENGRFTLYPTKNMYNFLLLDQLTGRVWQVQWNNEKGKRFRSRIY